MPPVSDPSHSRWELYTSEQGNAVVANELDKLPAHVAAALIELAARYERGEHAAAEFKHLGKREVSDFG